MSADPLVNKPITQSSAPEAVVYDCQSMHTLKCMNSELFIHKIPLTVQYALIGTVENKRREEFDTSLKQYGVCDAFSRDEIWTAMMAEIECLPKRSAREITHNNEKHIATVAVVKDVMKSLKEIDKLNFALFVSSRDREGFAQCFRRCELTKHMSNEEQWMLWDIIVEKVNKSNCRATNGHNSEKCDVQEAWNEDGLKRRREFLDKSVSAAAHIPRSTQTRSFSDYDASQLDFRENTRKVAQPMALDTKEKKWHFVPSWKKQPKAPTKDKKPSKNKTNFFSKFCPIMTEKSDTYMVRLKPPANECFMFVMPNKCSPPTLNHHENKEDIFICV